VTRPAASIAAIALALFAARAMAIEAPTAIRPTWGVLMENILDPTAGVATPSLVFNFGAGVVMPFKPDSPFTLVPSADFYYYYAELHNGRAVPTDESFSDNFVLGLILDAPVVYNIPLGQKFSVGAGAGPCLDFRVAFSTDRSLVDTPEINLYFWDKARFLTLSTVIRAEYKLTDLVDFGVKGRAIWPIYNLWAYEGHGFFDHTMYLIDVAVTFKIGSKAPAALPAPVPETILPPPIGASTSAPSAAADATGAPPPAADAKTTP
jgi:hypothetical protein